MQFSKTSEYAIRILTYMAHDQSKTYSANHLHKSLDLPYKYVTKLMTQLTKKKLTIMIRGRDGGFQIKEKLSSISVKDILSAIDENMDFDRCILGFPNCSEKSPCSMHNYWKGNKKSLNNMVNNVSLEDLKNSYVVKR